MQNQRENNIQSDLKKAFDSINSMVSKVGGIIESAKNDLETNEEKAKFMKAYQESGVAKGFNDIQKELAKLKL